VRFTPAGYPRFIGVGLCLVAYLRLAENISDPSRAVWKKDELLSAYLEHEVFGANSEHWDLEQTRAMLVYMSELLRRKINRVKTHKDGMV
jgi:hypothetical protein